MFLMYVAGFACPERGTFEVTTPCLEGFYCPGGDADPTHLCTLGARCAAGRSAPEPCPAGTYQNCLGQAECKNCPAGYFCIEGSESLSECPSGHYCPTGTKYATEFACPPGSFSDSTGLPSAEYCTRCTAGSYCETSGLLGALSLCLDLSISLSLSSSFPASLCACAWCVSFLVLNYLVYVFCIEPTGLCSAGHYCLGGAYAPAPAEGFDLGYIGDTCVADGAECVRTGDVCARGHYCLEGSASPTPCVEGTFNPARGSVNSTDCLPCTGNFLLLYFFHCAIDLTEPPPQLAISVRIVAYLW
jgi:hypothetical protein